MSNLYIVVNTGYDIRRNFKGRDIDAYEGSYGIEYALVNNEVYEFAKTALERYPSLVNIMLEQKSSFREGRLLDLIEIIAEDNDIVFDRWNPIFYCGTTLEALTILPKVVKICRELDWCNIWKEQRFEKLEVFNIDNNTNVCFLTLDAESG